MSGTAAPGVPALGWFPLPGGFEADAVPFAVRTTLALLLGYGVSFAIQLDSASSTGLCVAIVAQSSPGMSLSKAAWRTAGTLVGGVMAIVLIAAFAQDRTMLLAGFTVWLGLCTFVASLLRDFRAYGAVLSGYTVGIIAIGNIDTPDGAFLSALNRVAAILIGVGCVAIVNTLLSPPSAHRGMVRHMQEWRDRLDALAEDALAGRTVPDSAMLAQSGAAILSLRTEAGYAALELPGGRQQHRAAAATIGGMLGVLSATRGVAAAVREPDSPTLPTFRAERQAELARQRGLMEDGLDALRDRRPPRETVRLGLYQDPVGAWLNALRTMAAVALGSVFCVIAGWPGAVLLLVQQAAFTALFGMQPNPAAAARATAATIPFGAAAAFVIGFLLLPEASGFVPFALAFAPFAFAFALVSRHVRWARFGPGLMLYLTLLLAPANTEQFDLGGFSQNVFVQLVAVAFMVAAFTLILPVTPSRRLMRVLDSAGRDLRRALDGQPRLDPIVTARSRRYDRLTAMQTWLGPRTPSRLRLLDRVCRLTELEGALLRAAHGLHGLHRPMPAMSPGALLGTAAALLADEPPGPALDLAVSGLHEAAHLLREQAAALRHFGLTPRGAGHVA